MADNSPRWWVEFEYGRETDARERQTRRATALLARRRAHELSLADALPDLRTGVSELVSALIDASELDSADFARLRSLCLSLAATFATFQNDLELAVCDVV